MLLLGVAAAAFVVMLVIRRRWHDMTAADLGTMSSQWLAEYNAQHP